MKRSKQLQSKTPLRPTAFKRKPGSPFSSLANRSTTLQRSAMKKRARRPKAGDDKAMRDACRNEPCYLRLPGVCRCLDSDDTVVPAHRNEGKGEGLKNPDAWTVPACFPCHYEYDQGKRFLREYKREAWNQAFARWEPVRARKMGEANCQ